MTPSTKQWSCPSKIFFPQFLQKCCFFRKNCEMKKYSKPHFHKRGLFSFSSPDASFPSKETWAPETVFCSVLRILQLFLENTAKQLNNQYLICDKKKSYVNF